MLLRWLPIASITAVRSGLQQTVKLIIYNVRHMVGWGGWGGVGWGTHDHSSSSRDLTRDTCVPRFRCIPEHSIQMSEPKFKLAQLGSRTHESIIVHI